MKTLLLSFLVLTGCASNNHYVVEIDSLSDTSFMMQKIYVLNAHPTDSDLQKKEYERYVKTVLKDNGLIIVDKIKDADTLVSFNYALQTNVQQYEAPVYNYQAPQSYSYNGTTTTPYGGNYNSYGTVQQNGSGQFSYAGTRTVTDVTQIRGLILRGRKVSDLKRFEFANMTEDEWKQMPSTVWETKAISSGESTDMRQILPAMLLASQPYIGKTTKGVQKVHFSNDKKIEQLIQRANGTGQLTMK